MSKSFCSLQIGAAPSPALQFVTATGQGRHATSRYLITLQTTHACLGIYSTAQVCLYERLGSHKTPIAPASLPASKDARTSALVPATGGGWQRHTHQPLRPRGVFLVSESRSRPRCPPHPLLRFISTSKSPKATHPVAQLRAGSAAAAHIQ